MNSKAPLLLLLSIIFLACSVDVTNPSGEDINPVDQSWEQNMLDAVNTLRAEGCRCGTKKMAPTGPLNLHPDLTEAAQLHVADMERHDFFDHEGSDGSTVGQRAERVGYNWRGIAENIAMGHTSVAQVVQSWKDSPGHCRNMMNPNYIHLGAARINNTWGQVLGTNR